MRYGLDKVWGVAHACALIAYMYLGHVTVLERAVAYISAQDQLLLYTVHCNFQDAMCPHTKTLQRPGNCLQANFWQLYKNKLLSMGLLQKTHEDVHCIVSAHVMS